jgi:hypothetical protein
MREIRTIIIAAVMVALELISLSTIQGNEMSPQELIQSLVSQNKEPTPQRPHTRYEFPADFDEAENDRVIKVRDTLLGRGVDAVPFLIEALDDERYSCTIIFPKIVHHRHVREVCMRILEAQIQVYGNYVRPYNKRLERPRWLPAPPVTTHYWPPGAKDFMQKWWIPRQAMTLNELQREAVDWAVQQEESRGFFSEDERSLVLGWYKPLQAELASGRTLRVSWGGEILFDGDWVPPQPDKEKWWDLEHAYQNSLDRNR